MVLAGLVGLVGRFERPSPPQLGLTGWLPSVLLVACAALTGYALSRLAVGGFAPSGHLATGPLVTYAAGISHCGWPARSRRTSVIADERRGLAGALVPSTFSIVRCRRECVSRCR